MSQRVPAHLIRREAGRVTHSPRAWKVCVCASLLASGVVLFSFLNLTPASAMQRLCEHSDQAVAKISPCTGPVGTTINLTLRRRLASPPRALVFKRVLAAAGVQGRVTTGISNLAATAPPQLCTRGGDRWEVWLVDARGQSLGVIGAFWPDCRGSANANSSGSGGGGSGGNSNGGGGGNSNAGNQNGGGGGAGTIDQCLVGTWLATTVTPTNPRILGGGDGFRVTFKRDGTQTVDYSAMQPFQLRGDTTTDTGAATARISTDRQAAKIVRIMNAGVLLHISRVNPTPGLPMPGLGPGGLGGTSGDNRYTCTRDTLKYQGSMAADKSPNVSVTLTRQRD